MKIIEVTFNDTMQSVQPTYQLKDSVGKTIAEGSLQIAECNLIDVDVEPGEYDLVVHADQEVRRIFSVTDEMSHYSVQV